MLRHINFENGGFGKESVKLPKMRSPKLPGRHKITSLLTPQHFSRVGSNGFKQLPSNYSQSNNKQKHSRNSEQ